ncbi:acyltransferase [Paraburkholderia sp.]|uniref:acyltransferase family protein n=1 Tax=Paraburkholderia sp. TaxID=1926495 RepID=UPI002392CB6E|nr:acyltransferase [Paraburkholderia sp.]MDE1183024.1 acyltransferase [Paraburkholderia sp.]
MKPNNGPSGRPASRGRSIELDFVRGIAAIAVMGFHFYAVNTGNFAIGLIEYPLKNFGREGVNLFFTLSGFLVGGLLLQQYAQTGHIEARSFIIRRLFKIWPAYYALILFHALVGRHPLDTFLWQNLTHLQNYFGTSITQTWSLAVEEHFYLVLPALLLLLARWKLHVNAILGVLAGICVLVLTARCIVVANGDLNAAFMYTQYRIDSLLFGVMLAAIYWMKPDVYRKLARRVDLLMAVVALLVAWLCFATPHIALDESIGFTLQAAGYCAFIVLVLEYSGRLRNVWIYRATAWIGGYSYGIYLWHSIALAPGKWLSLKCVAMGLPLPLVWFIGLGAQFFIAISVGYVTTRLIEAPFLRLRNRLFPTQRRVPVPEHMKPVEAGAVGGTGGVGGPGAAITVSAAPPISPDPIVPTGGR